MKKGLEIQGLFFVWRNYGINGVILMQHGPSLDLPRCPHCSVAKPNLQSIHGLSTTTDKREHYRYWVTYKCSSCGGVILAVAPYDPSREISTYSITNIWPANQTVHASIPERARTFLEQAIASIHAPSGAVMLAGSSIDAMLKEKGLKEGNLYRRIESASAQHLITTEMAAWAHEIRLDANDQRHADENAALPDEAEAGKAIEFATALAQFLFVLPARVARGRGKE
ncbi:DUF4145 domain-containing protein [Pseudomonas alliivorans]|nr:DUF4145 domain-containing protein [Pseudomonas alliivorans]